MRGATGGMFIGGGCFDGKLFGQCVTVPPSNPHAHTQKQQNTHHSYDVNLSAFWIQ